jgi:LysM repeat protein
MNAMHNTMERTKPKQEHSAPPGKKVIMSNIATSILVALQFLWFFILGGVFYGYIDAQNSFKSIQVKLVQTEKDLTSLAAQISRVQGSKKIGNRISPQKSSSLPGNNSPVLPPAKETSKSIITINQVPSVEAEIKASSVPPAEEMLRHSEQYHEVNHGETLYQISKRYKISVEAIHHLNNLKQDQPILPGQKLLVAPAKP